MGPLNWSIKLAVKCKKGHQLNLHSLNDKATTKM